MVVYNYSAPKASQHKKPQSVEECLPQARLLVKQEHGRAALGPITKGDKVLIVTYADQDPFVKEAVTQALQEKGAEKVQFLFTHELTGIPQQPANTEQGWREVEVFGKGRKGYRADRTTGVDMGEAIRQYLIAHPEYTRLYWETGGRDHCIHGLKEQGHIFKNNWLFNNWEEFFSNAWVFPDDIWIEMERRILEVIGKASAVRITDPEGTYLEYKIKPEDAKRFQMTAWRSGHLFLDPLQATSKECASSPVSEDFSPVFVDLNGVLAGTSNHYGYYPRMEAYFEHARLVDVKGGGKYGEGIRELMDRFKDIQWPNYPGKGLFWFCDAALCTAVKAFRRTSDLFSSYWRNPNAPERNRAGIFHMGFGSRRHFKNYRQYGVDNNIPMGHIHVHNYFITFEVKIQGTNYWQKIVDKGYLTCLDDPEIRALAVKYGNPDEILSYDWVPPMPGVNCAGNYYQDYAPDAAAYLKIRLEENQSV